MALMWNRSVDWDARRLAQPGLNVGTRSPISSSRSATITGPAMRADRGEPKRVWMTTVGRTNPASSSPSPPTRNQEIWGGPPRRSAASSARPGWRHDGALPDGSISGATGPHEARAPGLIRRGRSATPHPPRSQPDPSDRVSTAASLVSPGNGARLRSVALLRPTRTAENEEAGGACRHPPFRRRRDQRGRRVNLDEGLLRGAVRARRRR